MCIHRCVINVHICVVYVHSCVVNLHSCLEYHDVVLAAHTHVSWVVLLHGYMLCTTGSWLTYHVFFWQEVHLPQVSWQEPKGNTALFIMHTAVSHVCVNFTQLCCSCV